MPLPALAVPLGLAAGGAVASGLGSLFKSKPKTQQVPRFNPQQTGIINNLAQQGSENSNWQGQEQQARRNFSTNTIPGLAERFTAAQGGGAQRSSAFQGALGNAGSDLEAQLAGMRGQFGLQQLGLGLQPTFDSRFVPAQDNWLSGALGGFGNGLSGAGLTGLQSGFMGGGQQKSGLKEILDNLQPYEIPQLIQHLQTLQGGQ
jgi:hypothetical protein